MNQQNSTAKVEVSIPQAQTSGVILEQQQMHVNVKVIVILSIFALFLITIGTVVLLNTYNPSPKDTRSAVVSHSNTLSQNDIKPTGQVNTLTSLANTLRSESDSLSKDEAQFESIAGK